MSKVIYTTLAVLCALQACSNAPISVDDAVYLGVKDYGSVTADQVKSPKFSGYRFGTPSGEKTYQIAQTEGFAIQNGLQEGRRYSLQVKGRRIVAAECTDVLSTYYAPAISGVPGLRTLKNLIATAFEPVGTALYVYGGGWDWQDERSSRQTMTIGLAPEWVHFFDNQDASYNYKFVPGTGNVQTDPATTTYPFNGWNQYYYAGLDCSGYIGWTVYNVMNTESSTDPADGFTGSSTKFAKNLAELHGFGTFTHDSINGNESANPLGIGDIVSIKGHVWMSLGTCSDGSVLLLHSTPSDSRSGEMGGGVQLSALSREGIGRDCEAWHLADRYMTMFFPKWSDRYQAVSKPYEQYTFVEEDERAGKFSWSLDGSCLSDPDGYATMTPEQLLRDLFGR